AVRRPVGGEGLADDPVARDRPPEAAVVAFATVVAHHEVVIGWNGDRFRQIADGARGAGPYVGLVGLLDAVDDRVPVADAERVPGAGDDPLDEVLARLLGSRAAAGFLGPPGNAAFGSLVGARRRVEDDYVADRG